MSLVWELELPDSEKIVLLALADCANDEGLCWPGMASLVRKCSKSERTVQYMMRRLEEAGHMTRNEVTGKGCRYTIHPRKACTPAEIAPVQGATKPPQPLHPTPAAVAPKPSKNRKEPSKFSAIELPEWMPADEWAAFVEMRKAMRSVPFTEAAKKGIIGDLAKLRSEGHDPAKVLMKAVKHGWRALFASDDTKGTVKLTAAEQIANLKKSIEFYSKHGRQDDVRDCRRKIDVLERAQGPPSAVAGMVKQIAKGLAA